MHDFILPKVCEQCKFFEMLGFLGDMQNPDDLDDYEEIFVEIPCCFKIGNLLENSPDDDDECEYFAQGTPEQLQNRT